jgi:prepilin peptidase CpaA
MSPLFPPDQQSLDVVTSLTLFVGVAIAVRQDLVGHRIPNVLTAGLLLAGLLTQSIFNGFSGFFDAAAGAGVGLACLLPLYLGKGTGAGDVKLMCAVGAFLGPVNAFLAAGLALVFGAVLAVTIAIRRLADASNATLDAPSAQGAGIRAPTAAMSVVRKERFPYAVAIGLGAIVTLWLSGSLDSVVRMLGAE